MSSADFGQLQVKVVQGADHSEGKGAGGEVGRGAQITVAPFRPPPADCWQSKSRLRYLHACTPPRKTSLWSVALHGLLPFTHSIHACVQAAKVRTNLSQKAIVVCHR